MRIVSLSLVLLTFGILIYVRPYVVEGESMTMAFLPGEKLFVESLSPDLGLLYRADPIVFVDPRDPEHPTLLKRIIGLPNEIIKVEADRVIVLRKDREGEVFVYGTPIGGTGNGLEREMVLGPEDYFLMGDNRDESEDSRIWGTIQPHEMIGKPVLRLGERFEVFPR